ncbi:MAG TPA: hypothetical protein VJT78_01750 [Candidatus Dormibacteraeota bacterium]|nr:hypothetical protein [Candidatus Dormibacteraeota bacterium]
MSRTRLAIAGVVLVLFIAAGGTLLYFTTRHQSQNLTFDLAVTHTNTMSPSTINAHVNDTITINIKSDTDGEVHLHVYDIPFETKAGQTVSHTFKAAQTCHCLIEWESTSRQLGFLDVTP